MTMNRRWALTLTALTFHVSIVGAAIQNSDFWFHEDGDTVFIDGARGAPLHIDYIGAPLAKPLKVRVTPDNPQLKVSPQTCTFTKKDDDCRLIVQLKKQGQKVYGVNHFTITGQGASHAVPNAQTDSDASTVGFGVGVQEKDMPNPIQAWVIADGNRVGSLSRAVIINDTKEARDYQQSNGKTAIFRLPNQGACYLDEDVMSPSLPRKPPESGVIETNFVLSYYRGGVDKPDLSVVPGDYIADITDPNVPIYNSPSVGIRTDITTCSANGFSECVSSKWASWTVGLANLGASDMKNGIRAGQVEVLQDNSWQSEAGIYYETTWSYGSLALLLIQGSTDGSGFDVSAPSILEIQSAPPCSYYLKTNPPVAYNVYTTVIGPGTLKLPEDSQCTRFTNEWSRCTASGSKYAWYEMTAIPDEGKTFKGWTGGDGQCDQAGLTCRFRLLSDVEFKATIE